MLGSPGTPTTDETRPPAAAGPRSRNFRFLKTSGGWPASSAAQAAGRGRVRRIAVTTNQADFFMVFSRTIVWELGICRRAAPAGAKQAVILPLRAGRRDEVPSYPLEIES